MPGIDVAQVPKVAGSGYPAPFDAPCAGRLRQRLGNAGGIEDFGLNLMHLPPGNWSSQRHWHAGEDEFVVMIAGEAVLLDDNGEHVLRAGDCAAFPMNDGNGHHLQNRSDADCTFIVVGVGAQTGGDYPDIDMRFTAEGTYVHNDGTPYEARRI